MDLEDQRLFQYYNIKGYDEKQAISDTFSGEVDPESTDDLNVDSEAPE